MVYVTYLSVITLVFAFYKFYKLRKGVEVTDEATGEKKIENVANLKDPRVKKWALVMGISFAVLIISNILVGWAGL